MSKRKLFNRTRKFLNKKSHHSTAAIYTEVEYDGYGTYSTFVVTDCARKIKLDFPGRAASDRANSLHKLDTLIESVVQFRAALTDAWDYEDSLKESE